MLKKSVGEGDKDQLNFDELATSNPLQGSSIFKATASNPKPEADELTSTIAPKSKQLVDKLKE